MKGGSPSGSPNLGGALVETILILLCLIAIRLLVMRFAGA